jgi:hypothetical protein
MRIPVERFPRILVVALPFPSAAFSDCVMNGQTVPEGQHAGGLVCKDGQWVTG